MSENPQLASRLLCLPFEVLARIYDAYLAFGLSDFDDTLRPFHVYLDSGEYSRPLPSFMLTCKRVYNDLREQVHTEAALKVYMMEFGSRIGFAVHGNMRYARLRKLYFIVNMEHAYWNRWLPMLAEVALRSTGLTEIRVDWQPRMAVESRVPWQQKLNQKKEDRFLEILANMKELRMIRLHGDVPSRWVQLLEETTAARVVVRREKWWKDPGRLW